MPRRPARHPRPTARSRTARRAGQRRTPDSAARAPRSIASPAPASRSPWWRRAARPGASRRAGSTAARSARKRHVVLAGTGITPTAGSSRASNRRSAQSSQGCQAAACRATRTGGARRAVAQQIGAGVARGLLDGVAAPRRHQVDHGRRQPGQAHGPGCRSLGLRAPTPPRSPPPAPRHGTTRVRRAGVRTGRPSSSTAKPPPSAADRDRRCRSASSAVRSTRARSIRQQRVQLVEPVEHAHRAGRCQLMRGRGCPS